MNIKELFEQQSFNEVYTDPEKIRYWVKKRVSGNFRINEDLSVDLLQRNYVVFGKITTNRLPIQINTCNYFMIVDSDVTSFEGCPREVNCFTARNLPNLTSLKGLPKLVRNNISLLDMPQTLTWHNIHKHLNVVHQQIQLDQRPNMLGLLLIKGLKEISVSGKTMHSGTEIQDILNKHLPTQNIFDAQEELLELGYIEEARI